MAFTDWSTTASANTTVGGIDIGEFCPPSNLNNMGRTMMAELRAAFNPALDPFHASASVAAARTALGALGSAGGTVTGNLVRSGAGTHLYHYSGSLLSGRVALTAVGAPDPFAGDPQPGDLWITGS